MKNNKDLFQLIKSLTKSEMRYFRLESKFQKGNKIYIRLFDEIRKMDIYDEKVIKDKFRDEKFIKQLTFTKNYLNEQIQKSLVSYYSDSSIDFKLHEMVLRARILFNKAMYTRFFELTGKAKRLAEKYERFWIIIELLDMEKVIIIKKIHPGTDEEELIEKEKKIIEKINNLAVYHRVVSGLTKAYRERGRTREKNFIDYLDEIKNSEIMVSEDKALSFIAKERYYFILQLCEDLTGNMEGMLFYAEKRYTLLKQNPLPFEGQNFNFWQDALVYMLLVSTYLNRTGKNEIYFSDLKKHSSNSETDIITKFAVEAAIKLVVMQKDPFAEGTLIQIKEITNNLVLFNGKMDSNYEILILSSITKLYLLRDDFEEALKYINIILNHPNLSVREDIHWYLRILNLIVHYELKNFELLEYLLKSTYKYLYKRKKLFKVEYLFMGFIRKLPHVHGNSELANNLVVLRNQINELKDDPLEKNALSFFDINIWIDKKIKEIGYL